jgi:hypothetical protein
VGPNPSSISKLMDNESKNPNVSLIFFIVIYKNPKFEDYRLKNGENTGLRRSEG